jgi:hypothetical protein
VKNLDKFLYTLELKWEKQGEKNGGKFRGNAEGDTVNRNTLLGRIDEIRILKKQ